MVESTQDAVTLSDLKADNDQMKKLLELVLERLDAIQMQDSSHIINNPDYWSVYYNCPWKRLLEVLCVVFEQHHVSYP